MLRLFFCLIPAQYRLSVFFNDKTMLFVMFYITLYGYIKFFINQILQN